MIIYKLIKTKQKEKKMDNIIGNKKLLSVIAALVVCLSVGFFVKGSLALVIVAAVLNGIYFFVQKEIDVSKTSENFKAFWASKKFWAVQLGNVVVMATTVFKNKLGFEIDLTWVMMLLGLQSVYVVNQGLKDVKEPESH